ncbi:PspC domain-containing protein [Virgibacillus sp. W0181]|uniref:PspC domain-containing protein n=1 Tax=Virgibacillus sp. W0181 TaxID=3391581 RepID=UPI003F473EF3
MKRLYRSRSERIAYGVLGGIAAYFRIDPAIVRLLFVAGLFLSSGSLIFLYIVGIFIIPDEWGI